MAYHDALTELPNRRFFYQQLQAVLDDAKEQNYAVALLTMDLNRFKVVNDTFGHPQGDRLLEQVAKRLLNTLGKSDIAARLGGDEFSVLISAIDLVEANLMVEKILSAINQPFELSGLHFELGVSIGIAFYPQHAQSPSELMRCADIAMYSAKKDPNNFVHYSLTIDEYSQSQRLLSIELISAINNNELVLYYQPIICAATGKIISAEALVRWNHPTNGLLMPDSFIKLAESSGAIVPLTFWVLEQSIRQAKAWLEAGLDCPVAVNLSTLCLYFKPLPEKLAELLERYQLPASNLTLEITESMIMADTAYAMQVLNRLNDMGLLLAIDDFGTGYSSLAYLTRLPVTYIKIDKSFVMDMQFNKDNETIVLSTIDLSRNLGLKVIAEGVVDKETMDKLAEFGCDRLQGYHFSKAIPADEFEAFSRTSIWAQTTQANKKPRKSKAKLFTPSKTVVFSQ